LTKPKRIVTNPYNQIIKLEEKMEPKRVASKNEFKRELTWEEANPSYYVYAYPKPDLHEKAEVSQAIPVKNHPNQSNCGPKDTMH
jgi:hypothetical protein